MSNINAILKSVPKTADGFDDIEGFWKATDKLSFPLNNHIRKLYRVTSPPPKSPASVLYDESDVDFNYETSASITDDGESDYTIEGDEPSEDEDGSNDEGDSVGQSVNQSGASSKYSPLNKSLMSIGLSPANTQGSNRSSLDPTRESILTDMSSKRGSTASTLPGSSRRGSRASSHRMSESGLDISLQGDVPDTDFDADVSNPMGDVTTLSEFQHQQKPGRGSSGASTKGRSSLTTPSRKHSTITADNSLELSGTKSKTATGNRSDRRVSFGQNAELTDLSPIAGTFSEAGTVSSKRTKDTSRNNSNNTTFDVSVDEGSVSNTSRNTSKDTTSKNNSRNTSVNVSRNSNTTAASIRSSAGKSSVAANSSVEEQPSLDDNNDDDNNNSGGDFDDGFGGGGDDYPEEEPEDEGSEQEPSEIDRYQSQADTPLTNKSMNRSGISSIGSSSSSTGRGSFRESIGSERRTPNTSRATRTPGTDASGVSGSSRISLGTTPGSHEFYRGRAVADDSFHIAGGGEGSDEDEEGEGEGREQSTDEEADTSAVITPISGRKRGHKHTQAVRGSDDEDADASTFSEGQSFVNNSFLHTIHSSNKKYVDGRKKLQDAIKPARLKQQQKKGGRGAKKLYSSDEEEEGGEQLHDSSDEVNSETGQPVRKSRRATKGRRFAFWKNERPIYEEGTMVGVLKAEPTPKKPKNGAKGRGRPKKEGASSSRGARTQVQDSDEEFDEDNHHAGQQQRLPPVRLPSRVNYLDRQECEELRVWDEALETHSLMKVVCTEENLQPVELPRTARRPHGRDKVGYAAHSFNVQEAPGLMSGWLSGYVDLPPEAIKDAEGVGKYTQLFFVSDCQDGALELGLAHPDLDAWEDSTAQRMLLKKGDQFYVPPGNIYRLENHSTAKSAMLFWTIIKPIEQPLPEDEFEGGSVVEEVSANSMGTVVPGANGRTYTAMEMDSDM